MKRKIVHKGMVLFMLVSAFTMQAQMDTVFWFVAPDVTSGHDFDSTIGFMITTTYAADVTISQPANPSFAPIVVSLPANTVYWVALNSRYKQVENQPPDTVLNYGILIRSTSKVTIYYEKQGTNNDAIFNLKGQNALGTDFVIPKQSAWDYYNPFYNPPPKRGFDIVATEDNTTVNITPSQDVVGHLAETPFNITLNKGQTFSVVRDPVNASTGFLEGTVVHADKPVAITLFDDSQHFAGGYDLTGDQIFPVPKTGKEYIGVIGNLQSRDEHIMITATEDGTQVTVNGIPAGVTLNKGQTYDTKDFSLNNLYCHIQTNKPVYAYHLSGNGKELTASILPPVDRCTGSSKVGFTRSQLEVDSVRFFANILVQSIPEGGDTAFRFYVNGKLQQGLIKASDFYPVGEDWKAARIDLTSIVKPNDVCVVENDIAYFHLGIFNASKNVAEAGYFSDLNPIELQAYIAGIYDTNLAVVCTGTPMTLIAVAPNAKEFQWSPSTYLDNPNIATPVATFNKNDSIQYRVIAKVCAEYDTAYVTVKTVLSVAEPEGSNVYACYGDPVPPFVVSNYAAGATLTWYADAQLTTRVAVRQEDSYSSGDTALGVYHYWVTQMYDTHCISPPHHFILTISKPLNQNAGTAIGASICSQETIDLFSTLVNYDTGGYWIDTMRTGRLTGSIFRPAGLKGGTYRFAYTFPWLGCRVDTVITTVVTDTIPPEIACVPEVRKKGGSIGTSYVVDTYEFNPLYVRDNCQYKLINTLTNDTSLLGATINDGDVIMWVAVDSGLNVSSCGTRFVLETIEIPNTISPNGDGYNDFFDISFDASYPDAVLEIYDRWGKKIYVSTPGYTEKWYGTVNGRLVPVDTYQYIVRDGNKVIRKGFISVVY